MGEFGFEVWQGGEMVASGSGYDREQVRREVMHYALVYARDGEVVASFFEETPHGRMPLPPHVPSPQDIDP